MIKAIVALLLSVAPAHAASRGVSYGTPNAPNLTNATGTLVIANGGTGNTSGQASSVPTSGVNLSTVTTALAVKASSGTNADITSLTGPISFGSGTTVSTFTTTGSLNLAAGASLQQAGVVLFSSSPVQHVSGSIIVGSLASGTTFMAFTPDAAITLIRVGCAVEVAGVAGSGDTVKCNNAAGTGISVTVSAAAAAGTYTSATGNAAIAYQSPVSCHLDSGAATRPIMTCVLEYLMQ